MTKVLMVAHDAGPCAAFREMKAGWPNWHGFLLQAGKAERPTDAELRLQIKQNDVVLVGLSSQKTAAFEIEACRQAKAEGRKLVFFSDTFGAWARPWFAEFRDDVSLVTVVVQREVSAAQALYPNAQVVATGNPAWEQFHEPGDPVAARIAMGAAKKESVHLISGCKDYSVNAEMLLATFEATQDQLFARVVFSQHPGDTTPPEQYVMLMDAAARKVHFTFLPQQVMTGEAAMCGADVVIVYNAASLALRAVALRIPLVVLRTPFAAARFRAESESEVNPLLQAQAAVDGWVNASTLRMALREALYGTATLRVALQAHFFPAITPGAYINALRSAVEGLVVLSE